MVLFSVMKDTCSDGCCLSVWTGLSLGWFVQHTSRSCYSDVFTMHINKCYEGQETCAVEHEQNNTT